MKKLFIVAFLAVIPSLANATALANATISNFTLTFLGSAPIFDPAYFYGYVQAISTAAYSDDSKLGLSPGYSFDLTATASDSASYAYSDAYYSAGNPDSSFNSVAGATYGSSYSSTNAYITFNYLAGTRLFITADALITGSLSSGDDYAGSFAGISLSSSNPSTGVSYFQGSSLQLDSINGSYSSSETLFLSYFSTKNQTLRFEVGTSASAYSVSAVPEPDTYGMMLMGIGLLSFMFRRRRNAVP